MHTPSRQTIAATALIVALTFAVSGDTAAADESTVFTFVGGGWGHSVGLSQYGAYGMSREGFTAEQIISHYYTGASVQVVSPDFGGPLWVNIDVVEPVGLAAATASFTVMSTSAASLGVPVMLSNNGIGDPVTVAPGETFVVSKNADGTCYTECGGTIIGVDCPASAPTPSPICDDTSLWAVKSVGGKCWNYCSADISQQHEVDTSFCTIGKPTATGKLTPKTMDVNIYLVGGIALAAFLLSRQ